MPPDQRKILAMKKEHHEHDMPSAQRKIIVPTSQMAKVKLVPGAEVKAMAGEGQASNEKYKPSSLSLKRKAPAHDSQPSSFRIKLGGVRKA